MENLKNWDYALEFGQIAIAELIVGYNPSKNFRFDPAIPVRYRLEQAYTDARNAYAHAILWDLEEDIEGRKSVFKSSFLRSKEMRRLERLWLASAKSDFDFKVWLSSPKSHIEDGQAFERDEIVRWLKDNGLKSIYQFDLTMAAKDVPEKGGRWPWGSHETPSLRHLELAALKFWVNYDPMDYETAPESKAVSDWLQNEHGVPAVKANLMASILRPDSIPPGPRKKVT